MAAGGGDEVITCKEQGRDCSEYNLGNQHHSMLRALSIGMFLVLATSSNGAAGGMIVSWGRDDSGQVSGTPGRPHSGGAVARPVVLDGEIVSDVAAVSAGFSHSLGLKMDGTVFAWGSNQFGQSTIPEGLDSVKAIAAGSSFSVALRADGTVVTWGYNGAARTNQPPGLNDVSAIAAGAEHIVALSSNGTVVAWGNSSLGRTNVPAGLSGVKAIAAKGAHTVALKNDGTVVAWGPDGSGQVSGKLYNSYDAIAVANPVALNGSILSGVTQVAAGTFHTLALKEDGTVVAWGFNREGQVAGHPDQDIGIANPVTLNGLVLDGVKAIAAGGNHSLALKHDGTVVAWGEGHPDWEYVWNHYDQATVPPGLNGVIAMDAGDGHSITITRAPVFESHPPSMAVTIKDSNYVLNSKAVGPEPLSYQWYKTGVAIADAAEPGLHFASANAKDDGDYFVVVSNNFGCVTSIVTRLQVITTPGTAVSWRTGPQPTATPSNLGPLKGIYDCGFHTLRLRNDGSVVAWGESNSHGELNVPEGLGDVIAVAGGSYFSLALTSDGTVVAWGAGQLNTGTWPNLGQTAVPPGLTGVTSIAAGSEHVLALKSDGKVVAWGSNSDGRSSVPVGLENVVAIAAGREHSVALQADGKVVTWGRNDGQNLTVPPTLGRATRIAAVGYGTAAWMEDETVVAWGYSFSSYGITPADLVSVINVSGGEHLTVALKSDGTVLQWTSSRGLGRVAVPDGLSAVTAIAADSFETTVLVGSAPTLTRHPRAVTVVAGGTAAFSAGAAAMPVPTFRWKRNTTYLDNESTPNLVLNTVAYNQAGQYTLVASNVFGLAESQPAELSVAASLFQPPAQHGAESIQTHGFTMNMLLEAGRPFRVQASTDLLAWVDLTNFTSVGMTFQFIDKAAGVQPRRFYRVVSP